MSDSTIITTEQTTTEPEASCSECGGNGWVSGEQYGNGPAMMRCPACSTQPTESSVFQDSDEAAAYLNRRIAEAQEREQQQERERKERIQRDEEAARKSAIGNLRDHIKRGIDPDVLAALSDLRYDAERHSSYGSPTNFWAFAVFTLQPEDVELRLSAVEMGASRLYDNSHTICSVHLMQPQVATDELLAGIAYYRSLLAARATQSAARAADTATAAVDTEPVEPAEPAEPTEPSAPAQPQILAENSYSRTVLLGADATSAKTVTLHSNGAVDVFDLSAYHPKPSEARLNSTSLTSDEFTLLANAHAAWMDYLTARNAVTADDDEVPF